MEVDATKFGNRRPSLWVTRGGGAYSKVNRIGNGHY